MSTVNVFSGSLISKAGPDVNFNTVVDAGVGSLALSAANVIGGMVIGTPAGAQTLTLPAAALLVAAIPGIGVGNTIEFTVQNQGLIAALLTVVLPASIGSTLLPGQYAVPGAFTGGVAASNSGCGTFRLRCTNITAGAEAFVLYRIG